jgi:hypothetical protein
MKTTFTTLAMAFAIATFAWGQQGAPAAGQYVTGDFHQHTTYTDGSYSMGLMMSKNNKFGLDWWANSEHGGSFDRWGQYSGLDLDGTVKWNTTLETLKGKSNNGKMWRWQSLTEYSFADVLAWRNAYPSKLIIQGYEMNVPGHEHASICVIGDQFNVNNPNVNALAQFEYMFDNGDSDNTSPNGWQKSTKSGHAKAVEAAEWLQANYPTQSWFIPAHPERYVYNGTTGWNIEHFRDLNNAAPDVFFGFESIAGHQMSADRGEYKSSRPSYGVGTYGGAGIMCAKVGGLWDAMLSEGRHFWVFANSDCHSNEVGAGDFFPGEYQKNHTFVTAKNDPQAIADGLRSGNTFCVMGDLINGLEFTVNGTVMGGTAVVEDGQVTVVVKARDPQTKNNNRYSDYTNPVLDHIDVIVGEWSSKIDPADANYTVDAVSTTKVVKRFAKEAGAVDASGLQTEAWTDGADDWKEFSFSYPMEVGKNFYFRLRGTNKKVNEAAETDASGNPLLDEGVNTAAKAFEDLWFYSNPVFVENKPTVVTNVGTTSDEKFTASVNDQASNVSVVFANAQTTNVNVVSMSGTILKSASVNNANQVTIDTNGLTSGLYLVSANNMTQKIIVR